MLGTSVKIYDNNQQEIQVNVTLQQRAHYMYTTRR